MVVLEKSEAGSRCITTGFFVKNKPTLGGTTDATASSVRPYGMNAVFIWKK
jgi:hypothetical protein